MDITLSFLKSGALVGKVIFLSGTITTPSAQLAAIIPVNSLSTGHHTNIILLEQYDRIMGRIV
jgi:hypothetical protein